MQDALIMSLTEKVGKGEKRVNDESERGWVKEGTIRKGCVG